MASTSEQLVWSCDHTNMCNQYKNQKVQGSSSNSCRFFMLGLAQNYQLEGKGLVPYWLTSTRDNPHTSSMNKYREGSEWTVDTVRWWKRMKIQWWRNSKDMEKNKRVKTVRVIHRSIWDYMGICLQCVGVKHCLNCNSHARPLIFNEVIHPLLLEIICLNSYYSCTHSSNLFTEDRLPHSQNSASPPQCNWMVEKINSYKCLGLSSDRDGKKLIRMLWYRQFYRCSSPAAQPFACRLLYIASETPPCNRPHCSILHTYHTSSTHLFILFALVK